MTQDDDRTLRDKVSAAWPAVGAPDFDATLEAAHERVTASRRRVKRFAGVAAAAAVIAIAMFANTPMQDTYVEVADLMETTYWTAPSDVLLPERQFDIYQDMPELFESTEPAGGTLL